MTRKLSEVPFFGRFTSDGTLSIHPALFMGLGLHLLWMYAVVYQSFPAPYLIEETSRSLVFDLGVITWIASILTMLAMGWFIDRITHTIRRHILQISIACVMSFGTICLFIAEFVPEVTLVVIGNILSGASSAFLILIWGEAFRRRETPTIVINTILSIVVAFAGYGVIAYYLPAPLVSSILCAIPLFEITALFIAMHGSSAFFNKQQFTIDEEGHRMPVLGIQEVTTFRKLRVSRGMLLIRLGIPCFLFGLAFGPLCRQTFAIFSETAATGTNPLPAMLAACLVASAIVVFMLAMNRGEDHNAFYRHIVPIVAITIFFISFQGTGFSLLLFTCIGYICFSFMMWTEFSSLSHHYRISPILIFGFGRSSVMAAQIISVFILDRAHIVSLFSVDGSVLNTFLILSLLIGYLLMPREKDIRSMAIALPTEANTDGKVERFDKEGIRKRFIERCEQVANTYLLSSRETDVFFLLAKGRNASFIAKQLFISEGTVHTHTWHIYRKLDVHTQQELMNLVDAIFVPKTPESPEPDLKLVMKR
ncbi:MAG: LuxR C-terminal-related transcriptional regulator [Coriobacteriales bacterium]|jgi:DNA-binding CsgD family transcriptional regulator|nr:LuxR C-terminal-related transcriptional regulator [Coriobacteriales bacterium]